MYVYKVTNLINHKVYVGKSSKEPEKSRSYFGSGIQIKAAIAKYGKQNFQKDILEICGNLEILNEKEKWWIEHLKSTNREIGYNISFGGDGGRFPDEVYRNRPYTGNKNPFYGKHHTLYTKDRIRTAKSGVKLDETVKISISAGLRLAYQNGLIKASVTDQMRIDASARMKRYNKSQHKKDIDIKQKELMAGELNHAAKKWIFKNNNGESVIVNGRFQSFCKQHNLSIKAMRKIAEGTRKSLYCNDWTVEVYNEGN